MNRYIKNILRLMLIVSICLCVTIAFSSPIYPKSVKSLESLSTWLELFYYENDPEEYWKSPQETINDHSGDCEDSTMLVDLILNDLKIESYPIVITFKDTKEGHALNIVKIDNKYTMFSNFRYYYYKFDTVIELLDFWFINWDKLYFINGVEDLVYIGENDA